jgi:uncharacterized protein YhdP
MQAVVSDYQSWLQRYQSFCSILTPDFSIDGNFSLAQGDLAQVLCEMSLNSAEWLCCLSRHLRAYRLDICDYIVRQTEGISTSNRGKLDKVTVDDGKAVIMENLRHDLDLIHRLLAVVQAMERAGTITVFGLPINSSYLNAAAELRQIAQDTVSEQLAPDEESEEDDRSVRFSTAQPEQGRSHLPFCILVIAIVAASFYMH